MRRSLISIGIIAFLNAFAHAQQIKQDITGLQRVWEAGMPFITNYTPEDYKASVQNWCFIQADNGIMYVGNTSGILEYDGVSWHLIKLSNNSIVRSFAKDSDGRIYVGGVRNFGFLHSDSIGQMQFQSLLPELDTTYHNFADVWHTLAIDNNIYFISYNYIFGWDGKVIKVWKSKEKFSDASLVNHQLYVDSKGVGILKLVDGTLQLIPEGDRFRNRKDRLVTMLPYTGDKLLLVHSLNGLSLYDHQKITSFKFGEVALLKDKIVYDAAVLSNGDYIFITLSQGAYVFSPQGHFKQWFNKKRGLISDVVYGVFVDKEGAIWLGTNSGISKVEQTLPLRRFNHLDGLTERVEAISWYLNRLYVGTSNGLYSLYDQFSDLKKAGVIFKKVAGFQSRVRSLVSTSKDLLVIAQENIYRVNKDHKIHEIEWDKEPATSALRSVQDSTKVYVGSLSGLLTEIYLDQWRVVPKLKIGGEIHLITENSDGSLWLSTQYNGVYKVDWTPYDSPDYNVTHYDTMAGLPDMSLNFVYPSKNKTYVTTYSSIFYFDEVLQRFKPENQLLSQFDNDVNAYGYMLMDESGNLWQTVKAGYDNRIYHTKDGRLEELKYSRRFPDFETYTIYKLNDLLLFVGPKGIIMYNQRLEKKPPAPQPTLIRNILVHNDSLIFGGNERAKTGNTHELSFKDNALHFAYALPSYDKPEANRYQYYLEGFDKGWSAWATETQRDFTNLPEGDYRFHVRGQNVYGQISDGAVFAFTILPPWYRTWWAYLLYGLAGFGLIGFVVRWRSEQLQREKKALENTIKEHTEKIRQKNRQLEEQTQKLEEIDHQKSRFFANISHEFCTPLTLIKGPVEEVINHPESTLTPGHLDMIDRNANRLLRLVNQLLDLSKLDTETLHLEPTAGDLYQFLHVLAAFFSSHAEQRGMYFQIDIPEQVWPALFDHDKLEKIVYNLLSNAFKFTPDREKVALAAFIREDILRIEVSDTGMGIPSGRLAHIFDRFYQVDDTRTREQEGTGIGLALTKELVSLMQGDITVQSTPGQGSTFTIRLPIKRIDASELGTPEYDAAPISQADVNGGRENEPVVSSEQTTDSYMILIVEDHADMRQFIREQLGDDYHMLEAADGEEGWAKAVSEVPDLVISDLMMPKMDGMELCRKLKTDERTCHIPVIMLTAKAGKEYKIEGLETGADSYLTKPFNRQELQVRVKNLIDQRRQLREKYSRTVLLDPRQIAVSSLDEQFLQKVKKLLENHISDDGFGVSQMQEALAMSKTQLHRKMKALTDQPPGSFLRNYRLKRAAQILSQQGESVTQVAYAVGFNNLSYFAKCFKELYDVTPSEYMESASSD